jgi:hypothetical protein
MSDEPVLEVGSSGSWVTYLKQSLAQLGYWHGDEADYFTDDLRHAVLQFQTDKGLTADGFVGPKTWEAVLYGANACEPPAQSDGGVQVVASDGNVVGAGTARLVSRQGGIAEVTGWPHDVIKALIYAETMPLPGSFSMFSSTLSLLWPIVERFDGTLGFGIGGDLAAALGYDAGLGFYVNAKREFGWYYTIGVDVGAILGVSGGACGTFVAGGPGNFAGDCYALAATAGELVYGGVEAIFNPAKQFVGVAFDVGVGIGAPLAVYGKLTNTTMTEL